MDENSLEIIQEVAHQRDQWRTIAIAYLVQCEKSSTHEKALAMLTEEQKRMVKDALTAYLREA